MWHLNEKDITDLEAITTPHIFLAHVKFDDLKAQLNSHEITHAVILECKGVNSLKSLLAEMKAKLNFPGYFGMNLDALWDVIRDPGVMTKSEYIVIFRSADGIIEMDGELSQFLKILRDASIQWAISSLSSIPELQKTKSINWLIQCDEIEAFEAFKVELRNSVETGYWTHFNGIANR